MPRSIEFGENDSQIGSPLRHRNSRNQDIPPRTLLSGLLNGPYPRRDPEIKEKVKKPRNATPLPKLLALTVS
jgi:hypothetical protein